MPPPGFGFVAVAGDAVVVAAFTPQDRYAATPVTLQFRNAKTGKIVASKTLAAWEFAGIRADTVGNKPVVEVRYSPHPTLPNVDTFVSTVFDTSAHQLWTSAGKEVSNFLSAGIVSLTSGGLVSHGYLLRLNPGSGTWHRGASYAVLDMTSKVIMTIPYWAYYNATDPMQNVGNMVQLIDGYAVVTHFEGKAVSSPPPTARFRAAVYDLAHGGKKVADAPETVQVAKQNVRTSPHMVASCGGKLVLIWATGSMLGGRSDIRTAVLDTRTGQTTPPAVIAVPVGSNPPMLSALTDSACSTALLYSDFPSPTTFAISLAHGTLLWRKDFRDQYLSMRDGVIYSLQTRSRTPLPARASSPLPGRLLSIDAADGSTLSNDLAAVPLAFTPSGSPVFAELSDPAVCDPQPPSPSASSASQKANRLSTRPLPTSCEVTVWVGRA